MSRISPWRTQSAAPRASLRLVSVDEDRAAHTSSYSTTHETDADSDDTPWVIPFRRAPRTGDVWHQPAPALSAQLQSRLIDRARILSSHRCCPECRCALIEPLELANSLLGRGNLPIPGTSTLVGFRCQSCRAEWPCESR